MKTKFTFISSKNTLIIGSVFGSVLLLLTLFPIENKVHQRFHSDKELVILKKMLAAPPEDTTIFFRASNSCAGCHGKDSLEYAMITEAGLDVNIHDDWQATMMANSAKDPFWRAKVSHEVLVNPQFQSKIEDKCTSCHAPMGHYDSKFRGHQFYTLADLHQDTLGLDGVSCAACHQISAASIGNTHSGKVIYDTTRVLYGPYQDVFEAPMNLYVGFEPVYGEHINHAGLCAGCHTLINETLDLEGNLTGTTVVEQATYHEWVNSSYNKQDVSCQSCHIPRIEDSIVIAANYAFLDGQSPYGIHELVGGNTVMLELMKANKSILDIQASDEAYDSTIVATYLMLQKKTLDITLSANDITSDTSYFDLELKNLAGHKFPSGYPSRRAFVVFTIKESGTNNLLFQSGEQDDLYNLVEEDSNFEPHHQVINSESQVQIYEMVLGDVAGNFTTVLERGAYALKDNRLPPLGFTKTHSVYDTTQIVGNAATDPNFNLETATKLGVEGDGRDILHFHIPTSLIDVGFVDITAQVYYQALPRRWLQPMFDVSSPEIDAFEGMYDSANTAPVLIAESQLLNFPTFKDNVEEISIENVRISISPNPVSSPENLIKVSSEQQISEVSIFDTQGKLLNTFICDDLECRVSVEGEVGTYLIQVKTAKGNRTFKILKL